MGKIVGNRPLDSANWAFNLRHVEQLLPRPTLSGGNAGDSQCRRANEEDAAKFSSHRLADSLGCVNFLQLWMELPLAVPRRLRQTKLNADILWSGSAEPSRTSAVAREGARKCQKNRVVNPLFRVGYFCGYSLWKTRRTLLFAALLNPWGATNLSHPRNYHLIIHNRGRTADQWGPLHGPRGLRTLS
jgi:hypothetical protein